MSSSYEIGTHVYVDMYILLDSEIAKEFDLSLLDNILDADSGHALKCPVGVFYQDSSELSTELMEAIDAKASGQYVVTATAISRHLEKEQGMRITPPAIRNHRRNMCACPV